MTWRHVVRKSIAWSLGPPLVVIAAGVGTVLALMYAPPGRALLVRVATAWLDGRIAGQIEIGRIGGNLIGHIVLEDVVLRDSTGVTFAVVPRLEASYLLPELLAGRIVLRDVSIDKPVIHLIRLRSGRWNYQEIFRSGHGGGGSAPPLVELRDVDVTGATIRVDAPTDPHPPPEPITRSGAMPAAVEQLRTPDGLVRVYRATELGGHFESIRISTPADDPLRVIFDHLTAELSDPALRIVAAAGEVSQDGDSLSFDLSRAAFPVTQLSGSGLVRWPQDTIQYDFRLNADTVALAELRWIQPDFPDWVGHGSVVAHSRGNRHTDFVLDPIDLGRGEVRATGRVTAMVDKDRGFGVADLDLQLRSVPLEVMRPYVDTLPFAGTLTGHLAASGYRDRMKLTGELAFVDALAVGQPGSELRFDGAVKFGGESGAIFEDFALQRTVLDLATVSRMIPSVELPGRLRLQGKLNGAWDNATFRGVAEHLAPNNTISRMVGLVRFDTRTDLLGLELDAQFDPLSFEALRTGYPDITMRGTLSGEVKARGRLDSLSITASVAGDFGAVEAEGIVSLAAPRYAADSLALVLRRFDLGAITGQGTSTALNGRLVVRGVVDSGVRPRGVVTVDLGESRIGGATVDEIHGLARSDGQLIALQSFEVIWPEGRVLANGTLGWAAPDSGLLHIEASAATLTPFDSLARAALGIGVDPDTAIYRPLDGQASGSFNIAGALDRPAIHGSVTGQDIVLDNWSVVGVNAEIHTDSLSTKGLQLDLGADSVQVGNTLAKRVEVVLGGSADSLSFTAMAALPAATLTVGGWRTGKAGVTGFGVDSLRLDLPRQTWTLSEPIRAVATDGAFRLDDTLRVATTDGSGGLELSGTVPGSSPGELDLSMVGVQLSDIYALLQRDTTAVGGVASVDLRLAGTRSDPLIRGNAMLTGLVVQDATPPLARVVFDYRDRLLRSNVTFWRTGAAVLEVDLALPYDLALESRQDRRLPGEISIRAIADSVDLSILQALTSNVSQTRGVLSLDLEVAGSWNDPQLAGTMSISEGRLTLPSLNVRYGPIFGKARFVGDAMVIDTLLLSSGEGDLTVSGQVRFADLSDPRLDLDFTSKGFLAINVPEFLVLRPTGTVHLGGPLTHPVLTGNTIRLDNSTLYFTDLISKDVIRLEDPAYANLVDLEELHRQRLGAAFQSRFLEALRVDNIRFQLGTNVRLFSEDADIQLEGAVTVQKTGSDYLVNGDLSTPRGTYTLRLGGFLTTEFDVQRGSVRFFGTPDLNAAIDIRATHLARTEAGAEIPIVAQITGTIQVPRVELSSPNSQLAQVDIVSYLLFGRPSAQIGTGSRQVLAQSALGLLAGEAERTIGQETGLDLVEFRAGLGLGNGNGATFNRFAIGKQLGEKWFITANAGFCLGGDAAEFSAQNFGASLEYRFANDWRIQASAEPVQTCVTNRLNDAFNTIARRYQLSLDVFWEREY